MILRYEGYKEIESPEKLHAELSEEMSDLLVFLFKLAYQTGVDVEDALRQGQEKANRRYPHLEQACGEAACDEARQAQLKE